MLVYTCWQNKQPWRGLPSARMSSCFCHWQMIEIALTWQPLALSRKTQQLDGVRPMTCSQGEASLLSAEPEQQMLGMNISGIPSPHCATISMNRCGGLKYLLAV